MHFVLLVILLILVLGALPHWPHASTWGYGPSGIGGLVLLVVILWLFLGNGLRHF